MISTQLRHRIDIEHRVVTRDEWGGAVETWTPFALDVPAEIRPLSGKEFIASASLQAAVDTRITIRFIDGVTAAMRVKHGPDVYAVSAVLPDPSLKRHLTLMCQRGVSDG